MLTLSKAVVVLTAAVLYISLSSFFLFPKKYIPFLIIGLLAISILALLPARRKTTVRSVINIILAVLMLAVSLYLPVLEKQVRSVFNNSQVQKTNINIYVLKKNHLSDDFQDYLSRTFLMQTAVDRSNQTYALKQLNSLSETPLQTKRCTDIIDALESFYSDDDALLILSEAYVPMIEDLDVYKDFSEETDILYTVTREETIEIPEVKVKDITANTFTVYVAGNDTRSGYLSLTGRMDVNLLLTVNPKTKQILIVGIPRDSYIPNPALGYGLDKLTHLGNNTVNNTVKGVGEHFGIDIDYYLTVNFWTFKTIVDVIDGIDVYNPYYFTTYKGNGGQYSTQDYSFEEGEIHLTGDSALAYVRERYNLANGDYGRNEHQTIVLKAVIKKILNPAVLMRYSEILDALKSQFLTDMSSDDILKLINMQINDGSEWEIINYHLGGNGDMCGTISMGMSRKLYVVHLFDSQIDFVRQQISKMQNNEMITKEDLPKENDTTFIPN